MEELKEYCKETWPITHGCLEFNPYANSIEVKNFGTSFLVKKVGERWVVRRHRRGRPQYVDLQHCQHMVIIDKLERSHSLWYVPHRDDSAVSRHFTLIAKPGGYTHICIGSVHLMTCATQYLSDHAYITTLNNLVLRIEANANAVWPVIHDLLLQTIAREICLHLCFFPFETDQIKVKMNTLAQEVTMYLKTAFPRLDAIWRVMDRSANIVQVFACNVTDLITDETVLAETIKKTETWAVLMRLTQELPGMVITAPIDLFGDEYEYLGIFNVFPGQLCDITTLRHELLGVYHVTPGERAYLRKLDAMLAAFA
jgi:hypothetical protein